MNKAQAGKKVVKKPVAKKKTPHPNDDYKNMVDPATGKKGTMGGEGTTPPFGGPKPKKGTKVYNGVTGKYDVVKKNGGPIKKAKAGGKFPDLNKDGKITKADILKGRGVIAQKGTKVKKQLSPAPKKKTGMDAVKALGKYVSTFGLATEGYNPAPSKKAKKTMKAGGSMKKCKYGCK